MPKGASKKGGATPKVSAAGGATPKVSAKGGAEPKVSAKGGSTPKVSAKGGATPKVSAKGGATPKAEEVVEAPELVTVYEMAFTEGDAVMAKWPGTNLFFHAKVTFVRDEDNEYDVQYEDGTIFTIKAKDVKKQIVKAQKRPARSRSRGRSPGRRARKKPVDTSPETSPEAKPKAAPKPKTPKPEPPTPTRTSRRLAEKAALAEMSGDETEKKAAPAKTSIMASLSGLIGPYLSVDWIVALIFALLGPFILVSLHTLCTKDSCKPALPFDKIPTTLAAYWDRQAFVCVVGFMIVLRVLSLIPVGSTVRSVNGKDLRMNGFLGLLILMALMPVMVYKKVDLSIVDGKYFLIMASSLIFSGVLALVARNLARFLPGKKSNVNAKGNTGNLIVDFINGREFNPTLLNGDMKLQTFRFSMIGLAILNVTLVINSIVNQGGVANPVVVMASAFQVLYALDAMFFEEYYFFSHDAMNTGFGFSIIASYLTFPFLPTLITQYLIQRSPTLPWFQLVGIALVNALGYVIFRASETQRCEFAKDPESPALAHLETLPTAGGKKLLISGWWGLVRHPNYLGEILIQWSWVLPAVSTAGRVDLLIYYLPIFTTLMLLVRCSQQNERNKKKYGAAWDTYCAKVTANLIPKIY